MHEKWGMNGNYLKMILQMHHNPHTTGFAFDQQYQVYVPYIDYLYGMNAQITQYHYRNIYQ